MTGPKRPLKGLRTYGGILFVILMAIPTAIWIVLLFLLFLPYTLYYYSANFGLRYAEVAPVQRYIDHFQTLHPHLTARSSEMLRSPRIRNRYAPFSTKFWPTTRKQSLNLMFTFSPVTGLFIWMEALGWPARVLWSLLKEEVKRNVPINEADKMAFNIVMEGVINHRLIELILPSRGWKAGKRDGFMLPDTVPIGMEVVELRGGDSMAWLLKENALVVPMDSSARNKVLGLQSLGLWKALKRDVDLEAYANEGWWQLLDIREVS